MTSHTKTYTNWYLFKRLKIIPLLSVSVMSSRSLGMPFKQHLLSIEKKYPTVQTTAAISSKTFLSVRMAEVFNSEFKTIQPFQQQRFSVWQRESDQIQLFVT